jgi:hypothetical protein
MSDCTIASTCAAFIAAIEAETAEALAAELALRREAEPLLTLLNAYPGVWVDESSLGSMPSLSEIVQRISNFGSGLATWRYWVSTPMAELALPAAAALVRVDINGVLMAPTVNYTLSGATLTFVGTLEVGDLVCVRSYGIEASP